MSGNMVYLEAADLTQDLLTIKWALRSAGHFISSTWHESQAGASPLAFKDHWNARGIEQLKRCDSLVVVSGRSDRAAAELAMIAGFALARGLLVIWIGSLVRGLNEFPSVQQFNTAEDFRNQIPQLFPNETRLAA
jgi:hypothetical protein